MVRKLNDHLDPGVGRALELLDQALAVALVRLDAELVARDLAVKVLARGRNVGADLLVDGEVEALRVREAAAEGGVVEVELVVADEAADVVVEPLGRRAVHHAVLAGEARGAVVVDDELAGLVEPAVCAGAVPEGVCALFEGDGCSGVEADEEVGGFDDLKGFGVGGVRT